MDKYSIYYEPSNSFGFIPLPAIRRSQLFFVRRSDVPIHIGIWKHRDDGSDYCHAFCTRNNFVYQFNSRTALPPLPEEHLVPPSFSYMLESHRA